MFKCGWHVVEKPVWGEEGHCVARDQLILSERAGEAIGAVLPTTKVSGGQVFAQGPVSLRLDDAGQIRDVTLNGEKVIEGDVTACLWRAPTDNDGGKPGVRGLFATKTSDWVGYGLNALEALPVEVTADGRRIGLSRNWRGADGGMLQHETVWTLSDTGADVQDTIIVPATWKDVPRVGIRFAVPNRFSHLEYYGRGPVETYPDRFESELLGVHASRVADQYHPYVRPQEYGAHEQTRWFSLKGDDGKGLRISLPRPLSFTARMHHDADLTEAETLAELITRDTYEVHIDAAMRGVGTGACGPDALAPYLVGPGVYRINWNLSAI